MKELKLTLDLVPATSWANNVRTILTKKQWNLLKQIIGSQAYYVCQICGGTGPKHPVEIHEVWSYDDKKNIQKLEKMIALCPSCHRVKHYGFAKVKGLEKQALKHFMKINKLDKQVAQQYIDQAFVEWEKRSQKNWILDLSYLKEFGIIINEKECK